jgi:NADPH:quinone reductase-like Zn-dependent oxidoreductase
MRALVLSSKDRTAHVTQVPMPAPSDSEVLIRVHAVALNPVDSLYVFNPIGSTGRVVGSDFAGTVEEINCGNNGESKLKVGDRVAGFVQGASSINDRPGAFAEYVAVPHDLVWKVADSMSFAEAATISLCGLTAAQALFSEHRLGLRPPWEKESETDEADVQKVVFIYGASTSVGLLAAQLIRHCVGRIKLIGCAGPKHFGSLRAQPFSYDELVDYRSDWCSELSNLTQSTGLDLAYDCISEGDTVQKISKILGPRGKMAIVRSAEGGAWTSKEPLPVQPSYGAVWEGLGEEVQYQGMNLPANAEARELAVKFYNWLSANGEAALKPINVRMMPGGLERIFDDGFQLLGSGSMTDRVVDRTKSWMRPVSAEKLVYNIHDSRI